MGDIVRLQPNELLIAAHIGAVRRTTSIKQEYDDYGFDNGHPWENDIVGAQSELAVAKYLNLYWSGITRMDKPPDVGFLIEVRSVAKPYKRLVVRGRDKGERPFVSVYSKDDAFEMRGWLFGDEVRIDGNEQPTKDGEDRYWLAENDTLAPFNRLRTWIEDRRKLLKT